MRRALVVDDTNEDRERAGAILEQAGLTVEYAVDGQQAMAMLESRPPDIVVSDVVMPEMDGLELVEAMHGRHFAVPIVVMTGLGSEEVAAAALMKGAASYVPKLHLERDLKDTVKRVLDVTKEKQDEQHVLESLRVTEYEFVLDANPDRFRALIGFLRRQMARRGIGDETERMQVAVAIDEALSNAIHHGNLEVSSDLRDKDVSAYFAQIEARRKTPPYAERRAYVHARLAPGEATIVVRDEGPGFDPSQVPDPRAPENLERASGRGLLLIRTIMEEVRHNAKGNEITMVKRPGGGPVRK